MFKSNFKAKVQLVWNKEAKVFMANLIKAQ